MSTTKKHREEVAALKRRITALEDDLVEADRLAGDTEDLRRALVEQTRGGTDARRQLCEAQGMLAAQARHGIACMALFREMRVGDLAKLAAAARQAKDGANAKQVDEVLMVMLDVGESEEP